jgi:hypothetical protein
MEVNKTLQHILRIVNPLGSELTFTSLIGLSEYSQRTTVKGMSLQKLKSFQQDVFFLLKYSISKKFQYSN